MEHLYSNSELFLQHLRRLLLNAPADGPAADCLREIDNAEVLFHPGGELLTVHVRRMYTTRTLLQSDSAGAASGDAQLLDALDREEAPVLRFVSIATRSGLFVLFTDVRLEHLTGIVRSPRSMEDVLAAVDSADPGVFVHTRRTLAQNPPDVLHTQFSLLLE